VRRKRHGIPCCIIHDGGPQTRSAGGGALSAPGGDTRHAHHRPAAHPEERGVLQEPAAADRLGGQLQPSRLLAPAAYADLPSATDSPSNCPATLSRPRWTAKADHPPLGTIHAAEREGTRGPKCHSTRTGQASKGVLEHDGPQPSLAQLARPLRSARSKQALGGRLRGTWQDGRRHRAAFAFGRAERDSAQAASRFSRPRDA